MKDDKPFLSLQDPQLPASLADARRNNGGMTVPDGFFEQFERKMNAVIDADVMLRQQNAAAPASEPQPAATSTPVSEPAPILRPRRWTAIAAMVAIVVAVGLALQLDWFGSNGIEQPAVPVDGLMAESEEDVPAIDLPEQLADEMESAASDYDVYEIYCEL